MSMRYRLIAPAIGFACLLDLTSALPAHAALVQAPRVTQGYGRTITPRSSPAAPILCKVPRVQCEEVREQTPSDERPLSEVVTTSRARGESWDVNFIVTPIFARDRESEGWGTVAGLSAEKGDARVRAMGLELEYLRPRPRDGGSHTNQFGVGATYGYEWKDTGWALSGNASYDFAKETSDREFETGLAAEYTFGNERAGEVTLGLAAGWVRGAADGEGTVDDLRGAWAIGYTLHDWSMSFEYAPKDDVSEEDDWTATLEMPFGLAFGFGKGSAATVGFSMDLGKGR